MAPHDPARAAIIIPGIRYTADAPLLMYARLAVRRRAGITREISWAVPEFTSTPEQRAWVSARVEDAIDDMVTATGAVPVVIGKSLASLAAPAVTAKDLAAIWLTPLLTDMPTVTALQEASAPSLLAGGTADKLWDSGIASSITPHLLEIEGADHAMLLPGPLAQSAAVLGRVSTAIEDFLDNVVWA